jgi:prepilin-type N-terminal cleavage/methylation domain-containing protein
VVAVWEPKAKTPKHRNAESRGTRAVARAADRLESRSPRRRPAFTLVELLLVMAILVVLISALIVVGRSQIAKGKAREAHTMLSTLQSAAQQFAAEKPLSKVKGYAARYGDYPPDELDGFLKGVGILGSGGALVVPGGTDLKIPSNKIENVRNGDIKAFALAVRLYSQEGAATLDRIPSKYRAPAVKDASGTPLEFLHHGDGNTFKTGQDVPLDYFVDPWGTPIAYFAAKTGGPSVWDSNTNNVAKVGNRQLTTQVLRSLSNDVPVFVSYGPDGPGQFAADFLVGGKYPPDLVQDIGDEPDGADRVVNNTLNADNLYSIESAQSRILQGGFAVGNLVGSPN